MTADEMLATMKAALDGQRMTPEVRLHPDDLAELRREAKQNGLHQIAPREELLLFSLDGIRIIED